MGAFAVLAALIVAASPSPSATLVPPVRVDLCKLDYVPANMHGFSLSENVGPLHITFANTGTKPIAKISFRVMLAGRAFGVNDAVGSRRTQRSRTSTAISTERTAPARRNRSRHAA